MREKFTSPTSSAIQHQDLLSRSTGELIDRWIITEPYPGCSWSQPSCITDPGRSLSYTPAPNRRRTCSMVGGRLHGCLSFPWFCVCDSVQIQWHRVICVMWRRCVFQMNKSPNILVSSDLWSAPRRWKLTGKRSSRDEVGRQSPWRLTPLERSRWAPRPALGGLLQVWVPCCRPFDVIISVNLALARPGSALGAEMNGGMGAFCPWQNVIALEIGKTRAFKSVHKKNVNKMLTSVCLQSRSRFFW